MRNIEKSRHYDASGLLLIKKFNWLRASEFGKLMWPNKKAQVQRASRLLRRLLEQQLVVRRELPQRLGGAYVLSRRGVQLLSETGIQANHGTDIGIKYLNEPTGWIPNLQWRHDLIQAGVIADFVRRGYTYLTELEMRSQINNLEDFPDALLFKNDEIIWLEVENSRKSGKRLKDAVRALIMSSRGTMEIEKTDLDSNKIIITPSAGVVAYPDISMSEVGHVIDHETRMRNAIAKNIANDVTITFAKCLMRNLSVENIEYENKTIKSEVWRHTYHKLLTERWVKNEDKLIYDFATAKRITLTQNKENGTWNAVIGRRLQEEEHVSAKTLTKIKEKIAKRIFKELNESLY